MYRYRLNSYGLLEACCMLYKLQSLLARRSDLDWWLWADNSRGSFLLRVVSSRHFNCSNFQGFQDFKVCFLTSIYIFYCGLLCFIVSMRFSRQILQPHHSHERQQRSHRHLQAGVGCGLKTQSCASKFGKLLPRCDACPAGQKQSTGGSTFCEDCGGPPVVIKHDQTWNVLGPLSLLCSLAQLNDVAHCLSRFATEVQNRCQDSILLLFFSSSAVSLPPCFARKM